MYRLPKEIMELGVSAEVVTATSDRERQIEDFEAGRTEVLLSMAILTEGFDCPSLQTVFCRPSSKGPTPKCVDASFDCIQKSQSNRLFNVLRHVIP